jgi:prevent-host-death family protein
MKFIPLRDIRNHPGAVLSQLKKEREIILTSHGKPVALMSDLKEETFERDLALHRKAHDMNRPAEAAESPAAYATENPEILQAWINEAERRYDDYRAGKSKAVPAFEALQKIRKKYGK